MIDRPADSHRGPGTGLNDLGTPTANTLQSIANMSASIIIPNYNCGRFLRESVASVLAQEDCADLEIIIIDDGSDDISSVVYDELENIPKVTIFKQANQGVSVARNCGLLMAKGDYLFFLDADDIMLPGSIAARLSVLNQGYDFVFSDYYINRSTDSSHSYFLASNALVKIAHFAECRNPMGVSLGTRGAELLSSDWSLVWTGTVGISAKLAARVGLFNVNLSTSEDTDYWDRALRMSRSFCITAPLARYNQYRGSTEKYERQLLEKLAAIKAEPAARRTKEIAYVHLELAYRKYISHGDFRGSRPYALRALCHWPWSFRGWMYVLAGLIPRATVDWRDSTRAQRNAKRGQKALGKVRHCDRSEKG